MDSILCRPATKHEIKEKTVRYFIHYNGWNKKTPLPVPDFLPFTIKRLSGLKFVEHVYKAMILPYFNYRDIFVEAATKTLLEMLQRMQNRGLTLLLNSMHLERNYRWDEWVPESRVLKFNETALQKQKELHKAHAKTKSGAALKVKGKKPVDPDKEKEKEKKKTTTTTTQDKDEGDNGEKEKERAEKEKSKEKDRASTPTVEKPTKHKLRDSGLTSSKDQESGSTVEPPKKKRARVDPTVESEETFMTKIEVKVKIPDELKPWLVDDWDLVTRQKQLVKLPAKNTVDNILDDYCKTKLTKAGNPNKDAILEVTQGIREYFNAMLGTQLLWKFERPQYAEVLADHPDTPMSGVYSAIHLLRLFVKLGSMLAYTPLDEKSIQLLLNHIHDFLKYMQKNAANLFSVSEYSVAPPEYHRKAI